MFWVKTRNKGGGVIQHMVTLLHDEWIMNESVHLTKLSNRNCYTFIHVKSESRRLTPYKFPNEKSGISPKSRISPPKSIGFDGNSLNCTPEDAEPGG